MSKYISKLLFGKNNSLLENIILCLAITLACAFTYYDRYNSFMGVTRAVLSVLIFMIWIIGAFSSGKGRKWGFLIFTGLYWLIPHLYMVFYSGRDNVRGYSKWLSLCNKSADILVNKPFTALSESTGTEEYIFVIILGVIVVSAYFIGVNLKSALNIPKVEPEQNCEQDDYEEDY